MRVAEVADTDDQARPVEGPPVRSSGSLDVIGQRGEIVRMRIEGMMDRLDDIKSLQQDFQTLLEPLITISDELPRVKTRLAETEALLAKEQQSGSLHRRELDGVTFRLATATNDLAAMTAEVARLESVEHTQTVELDNLRVGWRERSQAVEALEHQLAAEADQAKALLTENKALRLETQGLEQNLARSENALAGARSQLELLDQSARRTQLICEEQETKLADLAAKGDLARADLDTVRQRLEAVEAELQTELAGRQRSDAQHETEIGAVRGERASLAMKLEAALNRAGATEQVLAQVRVQLREKDEAFRSADRVAKEAVTDRGTFERRFASLQDDLARQTDRLLEAQRVKAEFEGRCEMLVKALAAKDLSVEQATARMAAFSERIDQMNRQREAETHDLEMVNRRLVEDLEAERSERALAQGALEIARESRASLQKQFEAMKRAHRPGTGTEVGETRPGDSADAREPASADLNTKVRHLSPVAR